MKHRPGYTLLEVILALAIGLLIVSALYVALDAHYRHIQSGRNAIAEAQLARGLLARISEDVRLSVAMLPSNPNSPAAVSASQTTSSSSSTSVQSTGSSTSSGQNTTSGSSPDATSTPPTQFNFGVMGSDTQLTLLISALPTQTRTGISTQQGSCDLRQVSYYVISKQGLAREETQPATSDGAATDAPDMLAPEVVDIRFRYFDAITSSWVVSWDGTTKGPPLAVEIRLSIEMPRETHLGSRMSRPASHHRMVVAVPTAAPSLAASGGITNTLP